MIVPPRAPAQQRPLRTDDAELLKTGAVRLETGVEFLQRKSYSLSGLEGDLMRLGVSAIHVGVGEYAEFQISGVFQDILSVAGRTEPVIPPDFTGNSTNDFGDLILGTKLKLAGEKGHRPAVAFKFAVELEIRQRSGHKRDGVLCEPPLQETPGPSAASGECRVCRSGIPRASGAAGGSLDLRNRSSRPSSEGNQFCNGDQRASGAFRESGE